MSAVPRMPVMVTIPAISVQHLTESTRAALCEPLERPFMVAPHDNGFFLNVPACQECQNEEQREEFATIPGDLRTVFDYIATYSHFGWMMLDVDGDVIPGLPVYCGDTLDRSNHDPMAGEHCETCGCALESGQIGHCEECAPQYLNCYDCPSCGHNWEDEYSCAVDEDCPSCGLRHISPVSSNEI